MNCFPDDDSHDIPDDELQLYFNKLVPPVMQRGTVEGQEIPATVRKTYLTSGLSYQHGSTYERATVYNLF